MRYNLLRLATEPAANSPRATPSSHPLRHLTPVSALLYHLLLLFYQRGGSTNVRASQLRTPTQPACYLVLLTVACLLQRNNGSARLARIAAFLLVDRSKDNLSGDWMYDKRSENEFLHNYAVASGFRLIACRVY